jgi:phosphomannomutase
MERVGHSFIKEKMKSTGALLAGETSGHFFFKDRWFGFDDGIYAALRCIEILCAHKDAFNALPTGFVTPEIRIECAEDKKFDIVESVRKKVKRNDARITEIDGIRVNSDVGWWILRASNTQNALSLRIEAYSKESMATLKNEVAAYLSEYINDIRDIIANK